MKLIMTLLVRDLADIVAANIEYHLLRGVDHIIVMDNGSVDETSSIVASYARGGRVTLIDQPNDDYDQAAWVSEMARIAWSMGADWVINDDADELWWPQRGGLKSVLARVPAEYGALSVPRTNMLPLHELRGHPFEQMVIRDVASVNGLGRPLAPKAVHRAAPHVQVSPGNHSVVAPGLGPPLATDEILIFHYPHRSYEQLERKIATGGAAVARNTRAPESVYDVWRELYKLYRAGRLRDWYDALPHADDPALDERIAAGMVARDERVAEYMRSMVLPLVAAV
ncbi:MAG TPA: glycosyltransferase family 2 protein [Candidatus Limnocylindrales bacterium]|nr:glycosyltransferase family 2 protein [Candidatus Limnocylindrales bacterium]